MRQENREFLRNRTNQVLILIAVILTVIFIIALTGCGHKAKASAEASALAHPTSSSAQHNEARQGS